MEIRRSPEMNVLSFELKATMATLKEDVGTKNVELFKEAIKLGLHPTGPQYWMYHWTSLNPEDEFTLKIAVPVTSFGRQIVSDRFVMEKVDGINYIAMVHKGPWDNLKNAYEKLMVEMNSKNIKPGMNSREVYINCDFENFENNITEIQFEVIK